MLQVYNTPLKRKENFEPQDPSHIKMYVCGPTVYATPHIGNARPPVVFDVLYRLLKEEYPKVTYLNNVTDVDDKINAKAKEMGISIRDLTEGTLKVYQGMMTSLGVVFAPQDMPRVTDNIPPIVAFIQRLVDGGFAYCASGHVLFQVSKYHRYGKLSNKSLDQLIEGARVDVAPYKKDPRDFVLWKPSDDETPGWESPWGRGRPGWHIECSALIKEFLGDTIDIHGGGIDLSFPHHENEVAQSNCGNGVPLARYWMHNGMITVNGAKMAKSLGNVILLEDILKEYDGEAVRLTLLSAHYRQPLDWTRKRTQASKETLIKFHNALEGYNGGESMDLKSFTKFKNALEDDLNIPLGLSIMHEITGLIHKVQGDVRQNFQASLKKCANLLGILQKEYKKDLSEDEAALLEKRKEARLSKNFKLSDELRDELKDLGVMVEDTKDGQKWTRI